MSTKTELTPEQLKKANDEYHLGYAFAYNHGRPSAAAMRNGQAWKKAYIESLKK
jgi:hypothetical protein